MAFRIVRRKSRRSKWCKLKDLNKRTTKTYLCVNAHSHEYLFIKRIYYHFNRFADFVFGPTLKTEIDITNILLKILVLSDVLPSPLKRANR